MIGSNRPFRGGDFSSLACLLRSKRSGGGPLDSCLGQKKAQRGANQQTDAEHGKGNGRPARGLLEPAKGGGPRPAPDVADGAYQTQYCATDAPGQRLRRDRPNRGESGKGTLNRETEKPKREPERLSGGQYTGNQADPADGVNQRDVSAPLLGFVRMTRVQHHENCRHKVGDRIENSDLDLGETQSRRLERFAQKCVATIGRSEEHTSALQSRFGISYA